MPFAMGHGVRTRYACWSYKENLSPHEDSRLGKAVQGGCAVSRMRCFLRWVWKIPDLPCLLSKLALLCGGQRRDLLRSSPAWIALYSYDFMSYHLVLYYWVLLLEYCWAYYCLWTWLSVWYQTAGSQKSGVIPSTNQNQLSTGFPFFEDWIKKKKIYSW